MQQPRSALDRRRFLQASAAAAASIPVVACTAKKSSFRILSDREVRTLTAVCEQFVPADKDPGATWAGVVKYIDRQLARHFREHQPLYHQGLADADRLAGGDFAGVPWSRQAEVLLHMEKHSKAFFDLVLSHTMQGFYGNPRHGGNREYASWRMLDIPPSPVRGRDQYDFTVLDRSRPS